MGNFQLPTNACFSPTMKKLVRIHVEPEMPFRLSAGAINDPAVPKKIFSTTQQFKKVELASATDI